MKNFGHALYRFSLQFIKYFTLLTAALFFICGFFLTCYAEEDQIVLTKFDHILLNILGLLVFTGAMYLIWRWVEHSPAKHKKILLGIVIFWYLFAGMILILFSKTVPAGDPMTVYHCANELAAGNTSVIHPTDSYLSYYPQQVGLVFFYEIIIRLWNLLPISLPAYHLIKCINIVLAIAIVYFLYKTVNLLFHNDLAETIYLLLSLLHLPLLLYTSYVYGEVPSFAFFCVGVWALLHIYQEQLDPNNNLTLYALLPMHHNFQMLSLKNNKKIQKHQLFR
jgi:hypothetical protein